MGAKQSEDRAGVQAPDTVATREPRDSHAAVAEVRELLARGHADPQAIAAVVLRQPEARDQVYAHLHQVFGNQFVLQVDAVVAATPAALPAPRGGNGAPTASGPSGSPQAMTEIQDEIAKGVPHPERIPRLAAMLSPADAATVRDTQLEDLEAKLTGAQTIAVYQALGQTPTNTAYAALRRSATQLDLARFVGMLEPKELIELVSDANIVRWLVVAMPGSLLDYTSIRLGHEGLTKSRGLMRWLVTTSTPQQIWRAIGSMMPREKQALATTLESEGLWDWVTLLSPQGMTPLDTENLKDMVAVAPAHIKPAFEALVAAAPAPRVVDPNATEAEAKAFTKKQRAEERDAAALLRRKLTSSEAVGADELMELVVKTKGAANPLGSDLRARRKAVALLSVDQLASFVHAAWFSPEDKLDWLLDKTDVRPSDLMEVLVREHVESFLVDDARVTRLAARIGDLDLGSMVELGGELQAAAVRHAPLRRLVLGKNPAARQLFRFVTAGTSPDSVSIACKVVARDFGYAWVYELTNEVEKEAQLRRLAIACPDRAAREHLMNVAIHTWPLTKNKIVAGAVASEPAVFQTEDAHLRSDVVSNRSKVAGDAIEMSDEARAAMRQDRDQANAAIKASAGQANRGMDAVRTARELDGTLPETLRAVASDIDSIDHGAFRTYARERPGTEQLAVAGDASLAALAETALGYSPLSSLPVLRSPAALAHALNTNPSLLSWIERTTSPVEALELLGANEAIAAVAAMAMERTRSFALIKDLPRAGLTVGQRAALARIGAEATGQQLQEAVGDRLTENADNDDGRAPPTHPDGGRSLGAVLEELAKRGASGKEIQAACSSHPESEARKVLFGGTPTQLLMLRAVGASPLTVFPWLAAEPADVLYASTTALTDWLLATEEPLAVLRAIAGSANALEHVAMAIDEQTSGANHFLRLLPQGHGLAERDEAALLALFSAVTSDDAALRVFTTRFGHAPDGAWSRAALDKLWVTLSRLPDRQVEANPRFGGLSRGDGGGSNDLAGHYSPGTGVVNIKGDGGTETRYASGQWQSKEKLAQHLGVDAGEIDRRVSADRIEKQTIKDVETFRVKAVSGDKFTYTLLHEMGHAVDALLGGRTELAFGIGGWKTYGDGDFDAWASEMGAWQGASVSADDKAQTRVLFEHHLKSSRGIEGPTGELQDMAPSDHALKSGNNAGAFLMKAAKRTKPFRYQTPIEHNGRMFLMNFYYGEFMSYDAKIHGMLPLPYAGFAPAEFFAECYVEYYREASMPGGNLPVAIKTWFDENVNRIGHGPAKKQP